jgi:hypothetical protein
MHSQLRQAADPHTPPAPSALPLTPLLPRRHKFYRSLLQCAEALCNPATASLLTWHSAESSRSIASAVAQMECQVSHFVRVCNQAAAASSALAGAGSSKGEHEEDKAEIELAHYLLAVAARVAQAAPAAAAPEAAAGAAAAEGAAAGVEGSPGGWLGGGLFG